MKAVIWIVPAVAFAVLLGFDVIPWILRNRYLSFAVAVPALILACLWLASLWWALHNLWIRILAIFTVPEPGGHARAKVGRFIILYTACDDFVAAGLQSCIEQDYPKDDFRVVVCDDSRAPGIKQEIDRFCGHFGLVPPIRRETRDGFKAGNLNHALGVVEAAPDDWVVVVDADDLLPSDYLTNLAKAAARCADDVAFLQGDLLPVEDGTFGGADHPRNRFRGFVQCELRLKSRHDMPWREVGGFYSFLGHGGAVRARALERLGGFPHYVAEDMAFSMVAYGASMMGRRLPQVTTYEPTPADFSAYLVRCRRHTAGAAEILRRSLIGYLRSDASLRSKVDICTWLATYALPAFTLIALWMEAALGHVIWHADLPLLSPALPYLFIAMLLASWAVSVSVTGGMIRGIGFLFTSFTIYAAMMPVMAWEFLRAWFVRPTFKPTPKRPAANRLGGLTSLFTLMCGAGLVAWALRWPSPFSLVAAAFGLGQAAFPLVERMHRGRSIVAGFAGLFVLAPGALFVMGVIAMWLQAS